MGNLGYVAKFKDGARDGPVAQLYYEDTDEGRTKAEEFARQKDEAGYSIYSCPGRLRERPRNKENVAELDRIFQDLDLRNIVETREQALAFCTVSCCRQARSATVAAAFIRSGI